MPCCATWWTPPAAAPSPHNTRPWSWRLVGVSSLELFADRSRQLPVTDPGGRWLLVSCGAALHHLLVAAGGVGLRPVLDLLPDDGPPDPVARVRLWPVTAEVESVRMLSALRHRGTDRRALTSWEVPTGRLELLTRRSSTWAPVRVVAESERLAVARGLLERARERASAHRGVVDELHHRVDRSTEDGGPSATAVPVGDSGSPRSGFADAPRPARAAGARPHRDPVPDVGADTGLPPGEDPAAMMLVVTGTDGPHRLAAGRHDARDPGHARRASPSGPRRPRSPTGGGTGRVGVTVETTAGPDTAACAHRRPPLMFVGRPPKGP